MCSSDLSFAFEADIVRVHPLSGRDIGGSRSDGLSELANCAAFGNRANGDFMEQGNGFSGQQVAVAGGDDIPRLQGSTSDDNIV